MKRFLILLLSTISFAGLAQNYQSIQSDFVHFFLDENGKDHGMLIDSVAIAGADSVFRNYLTVRQLDYGQLNVPVAGWLGEKAIIKPTGENLFFNSEGDTIFIETQSQLNDSWILFKLDPTSYLEATVSAIGTEPILDSSVDVKTITLQRKDYSGTPLNHPMNGKTIRLSNSLGIVQGLDFYQFPNDTTQIEIVGLENPDAGIHRLTRGEVYDFQVGDEFHYYSVKNANGGANPYWKKRMERVTSVDSDPIERKITFEVWSWIQRFDGQPSPLTIIEESSYYTDSLIVGQAMLDERLTEAMPNAIETFDTLPDYGRYSPIEFYNFESTAFPALTFQGDYNPYYQEDSLGYWSLDPITSGWDFETTAFGGGIGRTYWEHRTGDGIVYLDETEELIYFKKAGEEWGTPYTISEIMDIANVLTEAKYSFYPNPIKSGLPLQLGKLFEQTEILDLTGKLIRSVNNATVIETSGLPSGVYLVKLATNFGVSTQKLVVTD